MWNTGRSDNGYMKHRLLNLLTLLSLLLCVAVVAMWARSYGGCDVLIVPRRADDRLCVTSEFGVVAFEVEGVLRGSPRPGWEYFAGPLPRRWPARREAAGFDVYQGSVTHYVRLSPTPVYGVTIPHWFLLMAASVLPARQFARIRRDTRAKDFTPIQAVPDRAREILADVQSALNERAQALRRRRTRREDSWDEFMRCLRLRPPRHAGPVPGMRRGSDCRCGGSIRDGGRVRFMARLRIRTGEGVGCVRRVERPMNIIVLFAIGLAAAGAVSVVIVKWALSRNREPPGFPVNPRPASPPVDSEEPRQ